MTFDLNVGGAGSHATTQRLLPVASRDERLTDQRSGHVRSSRSFLSEAASSLHGCEGEGGSGREIGAQTGQPATIWPLRRPSGSSVQVSAGHTHQHVTPLYDVQCARRVPFSATQCQAVSTEMEPHS